MCPQCCVCGKFISYQSIEEGKASSSLEYARDGEPIGDIWTHKICEDKK